MGLTDDTRTHDVVLSRSTDPRSAPATGTGWRDRLVELHVLAEHGDPDAAADAAGWLASDPDAHQAWHTVEDICRQLRADSPVPRP